jgi:6-phosphofructokinase 2
VQLTVVTITLNPSVDYTVEIDKLIPEEKLRVDVKAIEPGGGGVQVARALRRLGADVEAVVTLGGNTGATLQRQLEDEGLNLRPIIVAPNTRPSWTVFVEEEGTNYRFVGRAAPLTEQEYRPVLDRLREIDVLPPYVVYSGSLPPGVPPEIVGEIAQITQQRESRLLVDTSGAALEAAVAAGVDTIKPSQEELAGLVGADPVTVDVAAAADEVLDRGVNLVIVSLGPDGVYLAARSGERARLRPPSVEVASTVAAGDSTVAGIVAALSRGLPVVEAARLGVAAGTGTCMYPGSGLFSPIDISALSPQIEVERL